ncbi:MAG: Acetyltransferase, GNAT family [uncultured Adhaeribacter sp.]|uniref:Acetyltransferase, GNAT family n=1 Tax=uncultured Adhaeribacter sp. TaxID=448109 RepID=A0A6J4I118_9BACT|nr:MAG: Acetyltransferase, GNAT family [uncultured Adhaeribacter sp.]
MEQTTIRRAQAPQDIPLIIDLGEQTWAPTYAHILAADQLAYMFAEIYNHQALQTQMNNGQIFLILYQNQTPAGFASYSRQAEPGVFKLNKIYVSPAYQGLNYGRLLINKVQEMASAAGGQTLELNVNRQNPARAFYEKCGFTVAREEDVPIGPYWMNDYVMQKNLLPN